ncbi:response regulator transcription factor [Pseudomonas denitrificans (nom. rej.)]|uniref:Response regulator transcription factor n=1 Tax=Pseudomonas denitrificans TaxID=43306 RepID=A0A9X7N1D4_PSEDE|nr:LuxR C-terminal-related transcriptional regulator [Pseudomonas denitrificans (nom. rej.)]QEY73244.1 response regulator transcription factor [Pseudomonas denitrificans (nom. rej.)]
MESVIQIGTWKGSTGSLLAERELTCLLSLASGMTDKEIARRDGLSPRSIKGRIESVMHKLGIYKRTPLVAEAIRRGIITYATYALVALTCTHAALSDDPTMRTRRGGERKVEVRIAARRMESGYAA